MKQTVKQSMKQTAKQKLAQTRMDNPRQKADTVTARRKLSMPNAKTRGKGYGPLDPWM